MHAFVDFELELMILQLQALEDCRCTWLSVAFIPSIHRLIVMSMDNYLHTKFIIRP